MFAARNMMFSGSGGTSIDTSKILQWWENGGTNDLVNGDALPNAGTTTSETIGAAFDTRWNQDGGNNNTILDTPADWDNYTVAFVAKLAATGSWQRFTETNGTIDSFIVTNTPELRLRSNSGSQVGEGAYTTGAWTSLVLVKDSGDMTLYQDGVEIHSVLGGASTPSSWVYWMPNGNDYDLACAALMDEAWGASQIADFHNSGDFLAYADL